MRRLAPLLLLALLALPARAQDWRPVELDLLQGPINDALGRQHDAAEYARRIAPEPPPAESLGEAWKRLEQALARVGRPRLDVRDGRIELGAMVSISVIFDSTWVDMRFEFEPRVPRPNVVELVAHRGREQWRNQPWKEQDASGLSANLRRLVEQMNGAGELAGAVTLVRGRDGAPDRIVVDLNGQAPLQGVEVTGLVAKPGVLTISGRTTRDRLELPLGAVELNDTLWKVINDPADSDLRDVLRGARLDVGRDHPGRITLHATADLPWLPATAYQAVFKLERTGPRQLRLTLEDVVIGGDTMDGFLRSRAGRSLKGWLLKKIFRRLDDQEVANNAAYDRGASDVRLSHSTSSPEVRLIDLRPGFFGAGFVRPGFELESVQVVPGKVEVAARLSSAPVPASAPPAPPASPAPPPAPTASRPSRTPPPPSPSRGVVGALGGLGD